MERGASAPHIGIDRVEARLVKLFDHLFDPGVAVVHPAWAVGDPDTKGLLRTAIDGQTVLAFPLLWHILRSYFSSDGGRAEEAGAGQQ